MAETKSTVTAKAVYEQLKPARNLVVDRARAASKLTIPGLIPEEGQDEHATFEQPYQSLGTQGTRALSSALLLALFPPNLPFFRLNIDEDTAAALGNAKGEADEKLAVFGRTAYSLMESASIRPMMNEAIRHLIVAGNGLLHVDDKRVRFFRIDQYVVKRDQRGRFMDLVVIEKVYPSTLDDATRAACKIDPPKDGEAEKQVDLYTRVRLMAGGKESYEQFQEINGVEVPGSRGSTPAQSVGWIPLRWLAVPGSDYGRSHVTENIGDLMSLEDLTKAIVQFAAAAARIINIVDPNSGIDVDELAAAESGDYLTGYIDRIQTLQLDKGQDWAVMKQLADELTQRLAAAFLIRAGMMRDAERVTAEEVRIVAQELENALGGTYTILSTELQLPLVRRFLYLATKSGRVPKLPSTISPVVVTGFDALGRAHSVNRLRAFLADLQSALGPERAQAILNDTEVANRLGTGHAVEGLKDLIKSPQTQQQEAMDNGMAQAGQAAVPHIVKAVAGQATQQE